MNKRIEVPVWILVLSAGLHLLWTVGLVLALVIPSIPTRLEKVIEIRVTATPLPVTETAIPFTATPQPTATPAPPTATRLPVATAVPCQQGEVPGVDCFVKIQGVTIKVVAAVVSDEGDEDDYLFVLVELTGSASLDIVGSWLQKGDLHIVGEDGTPLYLVDTQVGTMKGTGRPGVIIAFAVPKGAVKGDYLLLFPGGTEVDLSLVPEEVKETPVSGSSPTPAPTPTSILAP